MFGWKKRMQAKRAYDRVRFKRRLPVYRRVSNKRRRITGSSSSSPRTQAFYNSTGDLAADGGVNIVLQRKTLYAAVVRLAKPPSATDNLGAAEANRIHLKGVRFCLNIQNTSQTNNNIGIFHFAVVQEKNDGQNGNSVNQANFFANPGGGETGVDRTLDFVTGGAVDFRYNCNGLNRNRWNIVTHQRFLMDRADNEGAHKTFERYLKFNKTFMYETNTNNNVMKPLRVLIWWEKHTDDTDTTDTMRFNLNTISYFKSRG